MKENYFILIGGISTFFAQLFGNWSISLTTLVIFMVADYITGMIVAIYYKNSPKTESGKLSSNVGLKGIMKKILMLIFVMVGYRIDITFNYTYIKEGITLALIINEIISLIENSQYMGFEPPKFLSDIVELLNKKSINNDKH